MKWLNYVNSPIYNSLSLTLTRSLKHTHSNPSLMIHERARARAEANSQSTKCAWEERKLSTDRIGSIEWIMRDSRIQSFTATSSITNNLVKLTGDAELELCAAAVCVNRRYLIALIRCKFPHLYFAYCCAGGGAIITTETKFETAKATTKMTTSTSNLIPVCSGVFNVLVA